MRTDRRTQWSVLVGSTLAFTICFAVWMMFAVIGIPSERWGEEVAAAVVLKNPANEPELLAFCKEHLADFKRPKKIHIVETIPRTATGKIQRKVVASTFSEGGK